MNPSKRALVVDDNDLNSRLAAAFLRKLGWQARITARLAAVLLGGEWTLALLAASAAGWAGVCVAWSLRYGHWYGTPRLHRKAA
jgi:CheY-like chemotaxis protein